MHCSEQLTLHERSAPEAITLHPSALAPTKELGLRHAGVAPGSPPSSAELIDGERP